MLKIKPESIIVKFLVFFLLLSTETWARDTHYDYPIKNPYLATVIGTPKNLEAVLPPEENIPVKEMGLTVFKRRKIPDVFWYHDKFRFSVAYQKRKAPLIFNIAGTGSNYKAGKMRMMQRAFYKAGFHVVSLPSPTHTNFIVTASEKRVPGLISEDAKDLYRVMHLIYKKIKHDVKVTKFYLTGFSLGGAQAAFVAKLDEKMKMFNFRKVLLINPPVNLKRSVKSMDDLLVKNIPGGINHVNEFLDDIFLDLAKAYSEEQNVDFSDSDFFFALYKNKRGAIRKDRLKVLIGMAFRFSCVNMVFTSDVMSQAGYVVPKGLKLYRYDSLTNYFKVNTRFGFMDYYKDFLFPYYSKRRKKITKNSAIYHISLKGVEGYLKRSKKIGVMTNKDDIILNSSEVDYLKSVFGTRAKIFPRGGHGGNISHYENVREMIRFFKNRKKWN